MSICISRCFTRLNKSFCSKLLSSCFLCSNISLKLSLIKREILSYKGWLFYLPQRFITRPLSKWTWQFPIPTASSLDITNIRSISPLLISQDRRSMLHLISPRTHTSLIFQKLILVLIAQSIHCHYISHCSIRQGIKLSSHQISIHCIDKQATIFYCSPKKVIPFFISFWSGFIEIWVRFWRFTTTFRTFLLFLPRSSNTSCRQKIVKILSWSMFSNSVSFIQIILISSFIYKNPLHHESIFLCSVFTIFLIGVWIDICNNHRSKKQNQHIRNKRQNPRSCQMMGFSFVLSFLWHKAQIQQINFLPNYNYKKQKKQKKSDFYSSFQTFTKAKKADITVYS